MNNLLMWVAGLLALVLCALFAVPPLVDWNQYRGVFEEEVSRLLGREVRVGGRVSLRILPVPYVGFEKVRIADAPGIPGTFMRAERFAMLLSVPPLLRGIVEARKLEIDRPVVRLRFDENGGGNWQTLHIRQQDLAFVPSDIALQSANIRDGQLLFENHLGQSIASVDNITGELAAGTLHGPYKFVGSAKWAGALHDLRVSTAATDSEGGMRLKLTAESTTSRARHAIDGRLSDLATVPKIVGQLTTRAPLVATRQVVADRRSSYYDLRADVDLRPTAAKLSNITVSFDTAGRPQLLTGQAQASWQDELTVTGALDSKWLDLDAITGGRTRQNPFLALQLLTGTGLSMGEAGNGRFDISIEQANLGGEVVSALNIRVAQANGLVKIDRISAGLPGRAQLRADGIVRSGEKDASWQGHILLRGASLKRFLAWAHPASVSVDGAAAGAFKFLGHVDWKPREILVSQAEATFSGGTARGSINYVWGKEPRLTVDGEAGRIDLSGVGENLLAPENLAALIARPKAGAAKLTPLARAIATTDLQLRLRAGELTDGNRSLGNVNVLVTRVGDKVQFGRSTLTLEPGLQLELEGDLTRRDDAPRWNLTGIFRVEQRQSFSRLDELATLLIGKGALPSGLRNAQPLQVAFTSKSTGDGDAHRTIFSADGTLRSDRIRFSFETAGPLASWRAKPIRLELKIDGRSNQALAALFGWSGEIAEVGSGAIAPPSFLRLNASGNPARRMIASATLATGQSQVRLRARGKVDGDGGEMRWQGDGGIRARDAAKDVRSLAPKWARLVRVAVPVTGRFDFAETNDGLVIEPVDVAIGKATLTGRVAIRPSGEQLSRPHVRGRLEVDTLEGAELLAPLIGLTAPAPAAPTEAVGNASYWPDQPFDLSALSMLDADLTVKAARLELGHGLSVSGATLTASLADGALKISRVGGELLGGKLEASASLQAAAAGAELDLSGSLAGASLQRLVADALHGRVAGSVGATLTAKGQALSPRALATALQGRGQLKLNGVTLPGLPLSSLSGVADAVVVGDVGPDELTEKLRLEAERGSVAVGSKVLALRLADGALQIDAFKGDGKSGAVRNTTTIDVVRMMMDSEWQIDTRLVRTAPGAGSGGQAVRALPSVQVVYSGPLASLSQIAPRIGTGDLQRELTVRRMEHDVRRLEDLRREDEARAKAETQRLRRQERERIKALEDEARKRRQGRVPPGRNGPRSSNETSPAGNSGLTRETLPPVTNSRAAAPQQTAPAPTSAAAVSSQQRARASSSRRRRERSDPFAIDN